MSERSRHRVKSHHGCLQCRKRRVKCDERRPSCKSCSRRNSLCSYGSDPGPWIFVEGADARPALQGRAEPQPAPSHEIAYAQESSLPSWSDEAHSSPIRSSGKEPDRVAAPESGSLSPPFAQTATTEDSSGTELDVEHMRLMWYFTEHAWRSMASGSHWTTDVDMQQTWKEITPTLAFNHPFLLHSLLAISALHWVLACDSRGRPVTASLPPAPELPTSRQKMLYLSFRHHSRGLTLFRELLQTSLADEIRVPLFLTGVFVAMHTFAFPLSSMTDAHVSSPSDNDPIKVLLKLFTLLQGTAPIIGPIHHSIPSTALHVLMPPTPKNADLPLDSESEELFQALDRLHADILASSAYADNSMKDDYSQTLNLLRQTYILDREAPNRQTIVLGFAIDLPSRVLSDIAAGHSLALCIAAAYAVILHRLRQNIWVQGQGRSIVQAIRQRVFGDQALDVLQRCTQIIKRTG